MLLYCEIKEYLRSAIQVAWEIEQKLVEIRAYLDYGQFDKWLKAEFKWSRRTAYNYIRANVFGSSLSANDFIL